MKSITIRLSDRLKAEFDATLSAREMSASNVLRDSITNFVRNHKRQFGKDADESPVSDSKSKTSKAKPKAKSSRKAA